MNILVAYFAGILVGIWIGLDRPNRCVCCGHPGKCGYHEK